MHELRQHNQPPHQPVNYQPVPQSSGLAITSLILGIISIVSMGSFIVPQILAVIFGHIAVSSCKRDPMLEGRGFAIAGLIMGWICILLPILIILFFFLFLGGMGVLFSGFA